MYGKQRALFWMYTCTRLVESAQKSTSATQRARYSARQSESARESESVKVRVPVRANLVPI